MITILLISNDINAQYIFSLSVVPSNPSTNDTVTILASCSFPSAGCDEHTQYHFVNGNSIPAGALHCLGFMTVICNHTDTFTISPLAAGNYTFNFQLDAGYLPAPVLPVLCPARRIQLVLQLLLLTD